MGSSPDFSHRGWFSPAAAQQAAERPKRPAVVG
jgi:hypothetical protein